MQIQEQEKPRMLVSLGVVVLTILAIIVFALGFSIMIFYVCAVLAIALGFYLAFSLSREQPKPASGKKK